MNMNRIIGVLIMIIASACAKSGNSDSYGGRPHSGIFEATNKQEVGNEVFFSEPKLMGLPIVANGALGSEVYVCGLFGLDHNYGHEQLKKLDQPAHGVYVESQEDGSLGGIRYYDQDSIIESLACRHGGDWQP